MWAHFIVMINHCFQLISINNVIEVNYRTGWFFQFSKVELDEILL